MVSMNGVNQWCVWQVRVLHDVTGANEQCRPDSHRVVACRKGQPDSSVHRSRAAGHEHGKRKDGKGVRAQQNLPQFHHGHCVWFGVRAGGQSLTNDNITRFKGLGFQSRANKRGLRFVLHTSTLRSRCWVPNTSRKSKNNNTTIPRFIYG